MASLNVTLYAKETFNIQYLCSVASIRCPNEKVQVERIVYQARTARGAVACRLLDFALGRRRPPIQTNKLSEY